MVKNMEKMENKTLKEVYKNGSDEVKAILKEKFSKEELGIKVEVNQEEFNQFFRAILEKYKKNVRFNWGFFNYKIFDNNGDWLFDVGYYSENQWFWYSYWRILPLFKEKFRVTYKEINELMKPVVEQDLKLIGVTPNYRGKFLLYQVEQNLKLM